MIETGIIVVIGVAVAMMISVALAALVMTGRRMSRKREKGVDGTGLEIGK